MTDNIIPLRFNVQQVGKHVKGSKKRFTWQVSLNSRQHTIILDFSFISGKVKVTVDRKILLENELPTNTSFQYPFTLDGNALNVIQQGDNFELRINNKVFSHLYNQMKTNKQFKKYQDQVKDFNVNQNHFQAKKVTLNIGGMGMKKKNKVQSFEEHTWNAFGNDQIGGFPSYFESQSVSTTASSNVVENKQKKPQDNLLDITEKKQTKPTTQTQKILDFQAPPAQVQVSPQQSLSNDFPTITHMFSTLNMNTTNIAKQSVVIDSNQVDFFSDSQQQSTITTNKPNNNIDFFSLDQPKPVVSSHNASFNTGNDNNMQKMFATTNNVNNFGLGMGFEMNSASFATNIQNVPSKPFTLEGFTLDAANKPSNININNNNNNTKVNTPAVSTQGFETNNLNMLQDLFATNNLGGLNMQMNMNANSSNFTTGAKLNTTENYPVQITLQQKTVSEQSVQQNTQQYDPNQINIKDFSSMQLLFQTNMGLPPQSQPTSFSNPNTFGQPNISQASQSANNNFSSNFNTGITTPNMMGMNTYSGGNFGFGFDDPKTQFSTSANVNTMKNPPSFQKPVNNKPTEDLI